MTNIFNDQEMVFMFFGIVIMVAVLVVRYFLKDSNVIGQQNPQSDAEMEARIAKRRLNNYSANDADHWGDYWDANNADYWSDYWDKVNTRRLCGCEDSAIGSPFDHH